MYDIVAKLSRILSIRCMISLKPKSAISVMMVIAFIFEQMFCRFEGAMEFHCNREATKQMTKRRFH